MSEIEEGKQEQENATGNANPEQPSFDFFDSFSGNVKFLYCVEHAFKRGFQSKKEASPDDDDSEPEDQPIQQPRNENNFLKNVKWAPDGSCLLTNSDDNVVRLFDSPVYYPDDSSTAPDLGVTLSVVPGDVVYDYSWFPAMHSSDPTSCCFITTARDNPVHLWDAFTGRKRATYSAYDHLDEVTSAISCVFDPTCEKIVTGFNEVYRVFRVDRPGRDCEEVKTLQKKRKRKRSWKEGQRGVISCLDICQAEPDWLAAGSYSGSVCVWSLQSAECILELQGDHGGVTQTKFSRDGNLLFSAHRKSGDILCWDVRHTAQTIAVMQRGGDTNQRLSFDLDALQGRFLVGGCQDGSIRTFDLTRTPSSEGILDPVATISFEQSSSSCQEGSASRPSTQSEVASCVSLHPFFSAQYPFLAAGFGSRVFDCKLQDGDDICCCGEDNCDICSRDDNSNSSSSSNVTRGRNMLQLMMVAGHTVTVPCGDRAETAMGDLEPSTECTAEISGNTNPEPQNSESQRPSGD